ncbi:hypothetical protein L1887_34151 [Cichorium endivia]|nr:hypothetical protein L1887_34151 [Cichorium endivia]
MGLPYTVLGLLRFWRLRRVKQFFTRLEKDIIFNNFWVRCARLLNVTLFLVHCAGCIYYLLAVLYPHEGRTWIGSMNPNFREADLYILYVSAIYWSITTVGYDGDMVSARSAGDEVVDGEGGEDAGRNGGEGVDVLTTAAITECPVTLHIIED